MKPRSGIIQLKTFHVQERRRRVAQIEAMIADFMRMAEDLDKEIAHEEQRSGISDHNHFAYPTYAKAAAQRRDNLVQSAEDLKSQLNDALADLDDALSELRRAEALDDRESVREQPAMRGISASL
ncbi:flagellar export protein FliJ [Pseudochelatococcus contaminans]|uniref:Flagellar export protein FliJ n=1 Tax=Pseudochelatococcus contaminans TaxID=1538103 RepID=A0A7W5Z354_9HYPH|nr:flagellar export protein FliJ [Pseudochelatococcus contaminans]MBB3808944.1 flagellar export protein FliJ [Pseudochelatococcus contaminans]